MTYPLKIVAVLSPGQVSPVSCRRLVTSDEMSRVMSARRIFPVAEASDARQRGCWRHHDGWKNAAPYIRNRPERRR